MCDPKSECDANDEKPKNHHSEKCQCSTCISRCSFTESMQQHVPATNGMMQSHATMQKDTGPIVLRSRRVLSSSQIENISNLEASSTVHESCRNMKNIIHVAADACGKKSGLDYITAAKGSLTPILAVHDQLGNPINLNVSLLTEGGDSSECPEVDTKMNPHSNINKNVLWNGGYLKEHSVGQLITFSRRAKLKQDAGERTPDRNLKTVDKQNASSRCSSHVIGANFICEDSSQKCIFEDQVNISPILLENCVVPPLQVETTNEMANFKGDVTSDCTAEVCTGSKIKQKSKTISKSLTSVDTCKEPSKELLAPESYRDSQSSSTPCGSFVITDDENDARNKEIEWLESLENVLRERKENRGACSLMPNKSAEQYLKVQDITLDFVNHLTSFSQKNSLAKPPCSSSEVKQKAEKTTPFTDFLSRYLPLNPDVPLDLNSAASSSGSHFRDKVYVPDMKLSNSSNVNSSLLKHKKMTEKAIAEMMSKRYSFEWSEEELDFLWIGVRRHGVHNWNSILGDPKLQFARSRFPEDLALQWEQEQKKLFNGILFPPTSLSKPNLSSSTQSLAGYYAAKANAFLDNPTCAAETRLSLGDVYLRNENPSINSQFSSAYPPLTSASSSTCPLQGSYLSMASYPGAAIRHKKSSGVPRTTGQLDYSCNKLFWERSGIDQKPAGLPANTNLPHWLKEVYNSRPSDISWLPFFASGNTTGSANNDILLNALTGKHCEPPAASKDPRGRGILKRKALKIEEASASLDESAALGNKPSFAPIPTLMSVLTSVGASHQKITAILPDSIPVPVAPNDLVVIDSNASSEETISDDQNMRSNQDAEQLD